ncbi:major facilitator superfamily domain-containing protein [Rhexocercosporidium sp. MPI-PUGE-AT-0058]|nr:major facilitator superfamily domain-containing protein [Rhexocercosporidium sp. MPI-PUGE-AT-0058]
MKTFNILSVSLSFMIASSSALSFDPAGVANVGNGNGAQFIGGQCLSNKDCASNCCANPIGICSGIGASEQAGKTGCGFGGSPVLDLGNATVPTVNTTEPEPAPVPVAAPAGAVGGGAGGPAFDPSGVPNVGNGKGGQFIGGQCLSGADCASTCCAGPAGICSGLGAQTQAGKTGCGFVSKKRFVFSVFLAALDTTITTTALPTIASHFNSSAGYTWIGSAYLLATAASTPSWGMISDIFGRKPAILTSLALFFLGSLICGVASSMTMLIAGRAVQGTGGGGMLILVNICTGDLFSMRSRGMIFGFESLIWAVAAAVGPVLGGHSPSLLIGDVPCSGLAFSSLFLFLNLPTPPTPILAGLKAIDWIGSIAIIGATLSLLLGLEFGGVTFNWSSAKVICLIVFGFVIFALFFWNEKKFASHPVMSLRLFSSKSNVASLVVALLHGVTYFSASYYLPLYAQAVKGYGPLQSGLFVLPFQITISISSAVSGISIRKTGRYLELIYLGLSLLLLSMVLFIFFTKATTPLSTLITIQILAGCGTGIAYTSPLLALQSGVLVKDNATATSTFCFIRELSTAISVVLGGVLFQNSMQKYNKSLVVSVGEKAASLFTGKSAAANALLVKGLGPSRKVLVRDVYAKSLSQMWILFACTGAAALLVSAFISRRSLSKVHVEAVVGLPSETDDQRLGHL